MATTHNTQTTTFEHIHKINGYRFACTYQVDFTVARSCGEDEYRRAEYIEEIEVEYVGLTEVDCVPVQAEQWQQFKRDEEWQPAIDAAQDHHDHQPMPSSRWDYLV